MTNACERRLRIVTVVAGALIAASLLLPAVPDDARAGSWLDFLERVDQGKNKGVINQVQKFKRSYEKRFGKNVELADKGTSAAMKGDLKGAEEALQGMTRNIGMIAVDYLDPTDGRIEKYLKRIDRFFRDAPDAVAEAKAQVGERVASVRRRIGQNVDDARFALAVAPDEESGTGILDRSRPLPTPKRVRGVAAAPTGQASDWGNADEAPAARTSGWDKANKASSGPSTTQTGGDWGGTGSFERWVIKEQEANPDCYGIVDANADCGSQATLEEHAAGNTDDEGRRDYEAALADALGEESKISGDEDDYQGALSALEAKEEERKRQARLAEERRLEQLELERQARLAERRRIEQEERERQARLAEERRREAEAARTYSSSSSSSRSSSRTYNSGPSQLDQAAELLRQSLEALQEGYRRAYERNSRDSEAKYDPSETFDYNALTPDYRRR